MQRIFDDNSGFEWTYKGLERKRSCDQNSNVDTFEWEDFIAFNKGIIDGVRHP